MIALAIQRRTSPAVTVALRLLRLDQFNFAAEFIGERLHFRIDLRRLLLARRLWARRRSRNLRHAAHRNTERQPAARHLAADLFDQLPFILALKLFLVSGVFRRECRSEEHTSELQSLTNLVCRLLLEKKKKKYIRSILYNYNNSI